MKAATASKTTRTTVKSASAGASAPKAGGAGRNTALKSAAAKSASVRSTSQKGAPAQKTAAARPAGTRPAGARPAGARPSGSRPAGAGTGAAGRIPAGQKTGTAGQRPAARQRSEAYAERPQAEAVALQTQEKPRKRLTELTWPWVVMAAVMDAVLITILILIADLSRSEAYDEPWYTGSATVTETGSLYYGEEF